MYKQMYIGHVTGKKPKLKDKLCTYFSYNRKIIKNYGIKKFWFNYKRRI